MDLPAGIVEVCRLPGDGAYQDRARCDSDDRVVPDAFDDVVIDVADILPAGSADPAT